MGKIRKIVLDTIEFHPLHKAWVKLGEQIAKDLGVDFEVLKEDYVYAINYGDTDDLGMAWLPQLFAELEDGSVKLILSQYPFDPQTTSPDEEKAIEEARRKVEEIARDP
ncbi:MAG: hypothetical protein GSR85_05105 [Desulfurococcales archaeon]|nr:hypothetical protein [Desulfurococcales archaeon]